MQAIYRWALIGILLLSAGCFHVKVVRKEVPPPPIEKKVQVDRQYDFGGFLQPGRWYRGNLHLHSTISDGKLAPLPTVEVYRKMGYDFTALTDHIGGFLEKDKKTFKPLVYPLDQLNKPGFLVVPGMEYNTSRNGETIHFVVVGPGYDQRLEEGEDISHAIKECWDKGAFVFMAHPHWSLDATSLLEDLTFLPGVEVFNYGTSLDQGVRGNSQMYWDRLLRQSRTVFGVATDDCHEPGEDSGGGWVMVKAPALTADEIVKALRNGHFYFSGGPTLHDVFFDSESNLHVRCSPVQAIRAVSVVGRVTAVKAKPGQSLSEAVIKWDWKGRSKTALPFVRVECLDQQGRTAWTQAVRSQPGPPSP